MCLRKCDNPEEQLILFIYFLKRMFSGQMSGHIEACSCLRTQLLWHEWLYESRPTPAFLWKWILHFIWISRSQSLGKGTESMMLKVQGEVTVNDDLRSYTSLVLVRCLFWSPWLKQPSTGQIYSTYRLAVLKHDMEMQIFIFLCSQTQCHNLVSCFPIHTLYRNMYDWHDYKTTRAVDHVTTLLILCCFACFLSMSARLAESCWKQICVFFSHEILPGHIQDRRAAVIHTFSYIIWTDTFGFGLFWFSLLCLV